MVTESKTGKTIQAGGLTALAFLFVVVIGGSNAVAVRFSNEGLPPFWGAALRFSTAALIFWLIVFVRRIKVPRGRALALSLIFGSLSIGIAYAFLYWALLSVTASLTMVVLSLGPLLTFFFAVAHRQEAFRWRGLLGALVAFSGILIAIGDQIGNSVAVLPLLALLGGSSAQSESNVVFKMIPRSHPLAVNALALTVGSLILAVISLIAGEPWALPQARATWLAYSYLVVFGSVTLFYLYLYVLERWTASATSYSFLLFPISTILIASWLAGEVISPRFLLGGAAVLVGVWVGAVAKPKGEGTA